jgi:hypothetical protein
MHSAGRHQEFKRLGLVLTLATLLSACSTGILIGEKPTEPPPQVVFLGAVNAQGLEYLTWDRPQAFGKVPKDLQASGDISCMKTGINMRATGYHPRALDRQGKPTPGGGYFCQVGVLDKLAEAPRLVERNGQLGWDRPSAFGAIPESKLSQALAACQQQNTKTRPLGYHPGALDATGKPMPSGAFLCAE